MKDFSYVDVKELTLDINKIKSDIGKPTIEDLNHLQKMDRWCTVIASVGLGLLLSSSYLLDSTLAILLGVIFGSILFSIGMLMKWVIIAHPIIHGAYDSIEGIPLKYKRDNFGKGWRRNFDMFSWIHPLAWEHEHNKLHHGHLGTVEDPDTPINKFLWNRTKKKSLFRKYLNVFYHSSISGFNYYAKETIRVYNRDKDEKLSLWKDSLIPHMLRYLVLFLILSFSGSQGIIVAISSIIIIELITNMLSFFVISATHTGSDVYRFVEPIKDADEIYLREILCTVNYTNGNDINDFINGFLGYHIEHHVLPRETHLFYRKMQPLLEEVCIKHNVPYKTESMFTRFKVLLDNYTGQCQPGKAKL